jgi:hypothetical protein
VRFVLPEGWALSNGSNIWDVPVTAGAKLPIGQIPDMTAAASADKPFLGWLLDGEQDPVQSDYLTTLSITTDLTLTAVFKDDSVSLAPLSAPLAISPLAVGYPSPGVATVDNWADLQNAITTANTGSPVAAGQPITTIRLNNDITRTTGNLPVITTSLIIDGAGKTLNFGTAVNNVPGFQLTTLSPVARNFTLKNIDIVRPGASTKALVSVGDIAVNAADAPGSQQWTANLENINAGAGAVQPVTGLAAVHLGSVNLGGTINWSSNTSTHRRVTARYVTILENANVIMNMGTGTTSATIGAAYAIRAYGIEFQNNSHTTISNTSSVIRLLGSGSSYFRALPGATVDLINNYTGRQSSATDSWSQCVYFGAPSNGLQVGDTFTINGATVNGTTYGDAADGDTAGVFNLFSENSASKVDVNIINGGKLNAKSLGMQAAFTSNVPNSVMTVDGVGSRLNLESSKGFYHVAATLRFREYGNQTLNVTNGAEVHVTKLEHPFYSAAATNVNGNGDVAAIRFGQGTNNTFNVESGGKLYVETWGTGTPMDPANPNYSGTPADQNGHNVGIEVGNTGFQFKVKGVDSIISVVAHNGAAFNAGTNGNVTVDVRDGASFYAVGKTASATAGTFKATGGASTFTFNNPRFYDFRNDRDHLAGGGLIFQTGVGSTITSTDSDLAVWTKGEDIDAEDPYLNLSKIDYVLSGTNFTNIDSSNTYIGSTEFERLYRDMTYYSRMSGNNASSRITAWEGLTNADKTARVHAQVPEGLITTWRHAWTDELHGFFTITHAGTSSDVQVISKLHDPAYEEEAVGTIDGVLTYTTGQFLQPGDTYTVKQAWRGPKDFASDPSAKWNRPVLPGAITAGTATVADITPPTPAVITTANLYTNQTALAGTWTTTAPVYDDTATAVEAWLLPAGSTGEPTKMAATGVLNPGGTWTLTLPSGTIAAGDKIYVVLVDGTASGNRNPFVDTPKRDTLFPAAPSITVESDSLAPEINFTQYPLEVAQTPLVSHVMTADELKAALQVTDDVDYPVWNSDAEGRSKALYTSMVVTPLDAAGQPTTIDTKNIGVTRVKYVATDSTGNEVIEYRAVVVTDGRYTIADEDRDGINDIIIGARNFVVQQSAVQRSESAIKGLSYAEAYTTEGIKVDVELNGGIAAVSADYITGRAPAGNYTFTWKATGFSVTKSIVGLVVIADVIDPGTKDSQYAIYASHFLVNTIEAANVLANDSFVTVAKAAVVKLVDSAPTRAIQINDRGEFAAAQGTYPITFNIMGIPLTSQKVVINGVVSNGKPPVLSVDTPLNVWTGAGPVPVDAIPAATYTALYGVVAVDPDGGGKNPDVSSNIISSVIVTADGPAVNTAVAGT